MPWTPWEKFQIKMLSFQILRFALLQRFQQSIQNQAFRIGSENDNNDLVQKDKISKLGEKIVLDKLGHYKIYDFRSFSTSDAFKHVGLQITFNRYKVHQISPPRVDYAWFFVERITYQNVTQLYNVYALGP